ncbi:MAG: exopolyphosphatase [Desulfobacterales bacterium]|jgi:oligoribonuclease NrnB/cAMP/cGMP phosphodiesterase (DHH superfamily)|nr:exopolyphosphatase [Desulfobacterales bacterium]
MNQLRIVTRPDFDGVVCAVLLLEAMAIERPVKWVQPDEVQQTGIDIDERDILANLPFDPRCGLWFDHHYSNIPTHQFQGAFQLAPSAARVIYNYYRNRFNGRFCRLVKKADKIDSADFTVEDVLHPENDPYFLLSLTLPHTTPGLSETAYVEKVVSLLRNTDIHGVLTDDDVRKRCSNTIEQDRQFKVLLKSRTRLKDRVSLTDYRPIHPLQKGNRFLIYTLFPDMLAAIEICYRDERKERVRISVGHNIFNRVCRVNIGRMLSEYGGGGHREAGGCTLRANEVDRYLPRIIQTLIENEPNEDTDPMTDDPLSVQSA